MPSITVRTPLDMLMETYRESRSGPPGTRSWNRSAFNTDSLIFQLTFYFHTAAVLFGTTHLPPTQPPCKQQHHHPTLVRVRSHTAYRSTAPCLENCILPWEPHPLAVSDVLMREFVQWVLGIMTGRASPQVLSIYTLLSAHFLPPFCRSKLLRLLSPSVKNYYSESLLYLNCILFNTISVHLCSTL